jgi:hypothetical protein
MAGHTNDEREENMKIFAICLALSVVAFAATDAAPTVGINHPPTDDMWDIVATIEAESYAGNVYSVGVGFDGTYVWVTNGAMQGGATEGKFLLFEEDGTYVMDVAQNNAPGWGLRDLTCDGTYMYGSVTSAIDYYDITTYEKVGSFTGPQNPNRALAYDGTYFYTGNFGTEVYQLTWDGVSGSTASSSVWSTAATSVYGAAWDELNNCMWVTSADASGTVAQLDETGALVTNYYPVAGGTYGGASMGSMTPVNILWILNQGTPDQAFGFDVNPVSLERDTWGSIKSLF